MIFSAKMSLELFFGEKSARNEVITIKTDCILFFRNVYTLHSDYSGLHQQQ